MQIAVLSDIHDNVWNLRAALHSLATLPGSEAVQQMICCGDLCSPFVVRMLVEFGRERAVPVHIVFGNNDGDTSRITAQAKGWDGLHIHSEMAELVEQDGALLPRSAARGANAKLVAVQHYDNIARPLAQSGNYRLVCFGHNHQKESTYYGETLALNPGAIMGFSPSLPGPVKDIPATFAIYESAAHAARFFQVCEPWRSPEQPGQVCLING